MDSMQLVFQLSVMLTKKMDSMHQVSLFHRGRTMTMMKMKKKKMMMMKTKMMKMIIQPPYINIISYTSDNND